MPSNSASTEQHLDKLRRLRILQELGRVQPLPMGERALLNVLLTDRELTPTVERIRDSIDYLAAHNLVEPIAVDALEWRAARLTDAGRHWLNSDADHDLDIYNPGYQPPELPAAYNGRVSSIDTLPPETRAWLEQELIGRNFSRYSELTDLLRQQGLEISRSAVGRYAKRLKERVANYKEKAEMVKSLAGVFDDDAPAIMQGAMGTAVTAVLDAIEQGEYNDANDSLAGLVKALPALGKGFREAEKHKIEQAARRKTIDEAAQVGHDAAVAAGMDDEQARFWREKFLKGM